MTTKNFQSLTDNEKEACYILKNILSKDSRIEKPFLLMCPYIIPGYYFKECDALLGIVFKKNCKFKINNKEVNLRSLLAVIEFKSHTDFVLEKGTIKVKYGDRFVEIFHVLNKRTINLKNFILNESQKKIRPYIYSLIFFSKIISNRLSSEKINNSIVKEFVIFRDYTLDDIIKTCIFQVKEKRLELKSFDPKLFFNLKDTLNIIKKEIKMSECDRKKVEEIVQAKIKKDIPKYIENLGTQFLYFTGKAGTGKTIRLLRMAYILNQQNYKTLFLTYNHALAADIKRLVYILQKQGHLKKEVKIEIQTINQLCVKLGNALELNTCDSEARKNKDYDTWYEECIKKVTEKLQQTSQKNKQDKIKNSIIEKHSDLDTDFILVDEGQDWPEEEKEIVKWLAGGPEKLIVAIGTDQKTRNIRFYKTWFPDLPNTKRQAVPLIINLRQKHKLYLLNKKISEELLKEEWTEEEINLEIGEGDLLLIKDLELENKNFWKTLVNSLIAEKNFPVDCLIIEPDFIDQSIPKTTKILDKLFYKYWDGTDETIRKEVFPIDENQFRIVKYSSCRGLEGWTVIVRLIDIQYENYLKRFLKKFKSRHSQLSLLSNNDRIKKEAEKETLIQLRIALTRAIAKIIITYKNENHKIIKKLNNLLKAVNKEI